ncbi:MAG TPA: hypothetical protein VIM14_04875 [Polyangia bacterium]
MIASVAWSTGSSAQPTAPTGAAASAAIDRVLTLCASRDLEPRLYCIDVLAEHGDPEGRARPTLYRMAADPATYDHAARAIVRLYGMPAPPRPGQSAGAQPPIEQVNAGSSEHRDPGRGRILLFPTAYTTEKGKVSFATTDLGYWDINYGVGDNTEIGLRTGPPIGLFAVMPQLKISLPFDGGAIAFHGLGGFFAPIVGRSSWSLLILGGGPTLSLGKDVVFNLGTEVYGVFVDHESAGLVLPYAGISFPISRRASLGVEFVAPGVFDSKDSYFGKIEFLLYGLRIRGDSIWGDIGFVAPICEGGCGDFYQVLPFGFPLLNFGFNI